MARRNLHLLLALLSLLAACGRSGGEHTAGSSPTKGRKGQGQQIVVTETDFKITMPKTLRAGTVTFEVENKGKVVHNLEIEGNGIDKKLSSNLDPGQKGTLTVNLKPGKYHVWCPVDGHADLGMNLHITVK